MKFVKCTEMLQMSWKWKFCSDFGAHLHQQYFLRFVVNLSLQILLTSQLPNECDRNERRPTFMILTMSTIRKMLICWLDLDSWVSLVRWFNKVTFCFRTSAFFVFVADCTRTSTVLCGLYNKRACSCSRYIIERYLG